MKIQGIDSVSDPSDCEKLKKTRSSRKRKIFDETDNRIVKKNLVHAPYFINDVANSVDEDDDSLVSAQEEDNSFTSQEETDSDRTNKESPASLNVIPSLTTTSINTDLLNMVSSIRDGMEVIKGEK